MSKAESLNSSQIETKIAAYGVKVTDRIPALNTLVVSATDTAFFAALSNANVSIGVNMEISRPSVPQFTANNPLENIGTDETYYSDLKDNILSEKGRNFVSIVDVFGSDACITIPECDHSSTGLDYFASYFYYGIDLVDISA